MHRMLWSEKNPDENNNNNNNNNGKKTKENKKNKIVALQFLVKIVCEAMEHSPQSPPLLSFPERDRIIENTSLRTAKSRSFN